MVYFTLKITEVIKLIIKIQAEETGEKRLPHPHPRCLSSPAKPHLPGPHVCDLSTYALLAATSLPPGRKHRAHSAPLSWECFCG